MKLNTLNTIIDDILLRLRNSIVSESEHISRIQIEQWIHNYRALLIKQDVDKGRDINPQYVQIIKKVHLDEIIESPGSFEHVSEIELPKLIDFNYRSGLVGVTDMHWNQIQVGTMQKTKYQKYRKYGCSDYIAYVKDNRVYVEGDNDKLEYINLFVVAENPAEVEDCFNPDELYPIPANMIPVLIDMIFQKELNIMPQMLSDTTNNTQDDVQRK